MTNSHFSVEKLVIKTLQRLHCKPQMTAIFQPKLALPHTEQDRSNTDTVTHSNHNSESAHSQTCRQTPLSANTHKPSPRTPGEVSVHLGHFPFVLPSVCLSVACAICVLWLYPHRNVVCYEEGGEM